MIDPTVVLCVVSFVSNVIFAWQWATLRGEVRGLRAALEARGVPLLQLAQASSTLPATSAQVPR